MSGPSPDPPTARRPFAERVDLPILVAGGFILVILAVGASIDRGFLAPRYLIQQLEVGAFLGVVAIGAMLVILLGHIDLSVPWTLAAGAMLGTGLAGHALGGAGAIPIALAVGALAGLVNGIGVAYLRIPSMIFTLGVNAVLEGLMVLYTGGSAPQSSAQPVVSFLTRGEPVPGVPNAILVWLAIGIAASLALRRTAFGRIVYAIGNRERAAYLSGMPVRPVTCLVFVLAGVASATAGLLITGYAGKAFQGMGDNELLPAIAAVVLGGTSILGGRGRMAGTAIGTIMITLLQSILAVMQLPDALRQVIYGLVILTMLMLYGRSRQARA